VLCSLATTVERCLAALAYPDNAMIRTIATAIALLWTAPVVTEKAEVRDHGEIDLAPFTCTDTPRSTVIQNVCYNSTTRHLLIGIRGSYRDYCDVPPATFDAFMTTLSMGHFYKHTIATTDVDGPFHCIPARAPAK
jgi:KTSC domain